MIYFSGPNVCVQLDNEVSEVKSLFFKVLRLFKIEFWTKFWTSDRCDVRKGTNSSLDKAFTPPTQRLNISQLKLLYLLHDES